jgi:hypothetical protein
MRRIIGLAMASLCVCFTVMACGAADEDLGESESALIVADDLPSDDPPPPTPTSTPTEKPKPTYPAGGKCKVLEGVNKGMIGRYDSNGYCCRDNNCTYCPRSKCQTLLTSDTPIYNPEPPIYYPGPF